MRKLAIVVLTLLAGFGISRASTIVSTFSTTSPGYVADAYQVSLSNGIFGSSGTDWAFGFTVPSGSDYLFSGSRAFYLFGNCYHR